MTDELIDKIDDVKKEFSNFFETKYKDDLLYYGDSFGDLITGTLWEKIACRVFKNVFGESFQDYTCHNLCYDAKVGEETISFKGSYAKYAKTIKKHTFTLTQYRTTKYIDIDDKKKFINESIKSTNYELACIRNDYDKTFKFKILLFKKSIFSIPKHKMFVKKHETKSRLSKQRYFKCELDKNISLIIAGSASDQLMAQIKNLDEFVRQSDAIILYDNFNQKESTV
jgi:hypothetical protein